MGSSAQTTGSSDSTQPLNLGPQGQFPDSALLQISIEDALQSAENMSPEEFIVQAQSMQFNVSSFIILTDSGYLPAL